MNLFQSITGIRILFILGILNGVLMLLVYFTCRCTPGARIFNRAMGGLMKHRWYQRIYGLHCYLWPLLWASVIVHAVFAFGSIGFPF